MSDTEKSTVVNVTVNAPGKSMAAAIILTFLFGPLGLFYASVTGGLVLLLVDLVAIPVSFLTLGVGAIVFPIVWILSIIWAVLAVQGKDRQVITKIQHGDLSGAARTAIDPAKDGQE